MARIATALRTAVGPLPTDPPAAKKKKATKPRLNRAFLRAFALSAINRNHPQKDRQHGR